MKLLSKLKTFIYIRPLHRLSYKLIMSPSSKNRFYEKYIRWQLSVTLENIIYGDKKWKNAFKYIWLNKVMVIMMILATSTLFLVYHMGSQSREKEISSLIASNDYKYEIIQSQSVAIHNNELIIDDKNNMIDSLNKFRESRDWLEYMIYSETKMDDFYLNMSRVDDDILFLMASQADKYEIPYSIYFRLIDVESGYKFIPNHGGSGAFGYMQVMPATFNSYAKKLNLKGGHTKKNNILVGSYMLYKNHKDWMDRGYDDRKAWEFALSEYNAGERNLQIVNGDKVVGWRIPSYTKSYISEIMETYNEESINCYSED